MRIYHIKRKDGDKVNEYREAVVFANDEDEATRIYPGTGEVVPLEQFGCLRRYPDGKWGWLWAQDPTDVHAEYIGKAEWMEGQPGVRRTIMADRNNLL